MCSKAWKCGREEEDDGEICRESEERWRRGEREVKTIESEE